MLTPSAFPLSIHRICVRVYDFELVAFSILRLHESVPSDLL